MTLRVSSDEEIQECDRYRDSVTTAEFAAPVAIPEASRRNLRRLLHAT